MRLARGARALRRISRLLVDGMLASLRRHLSSNHKSPRVKQRLSELIPLQSMTPGVSTLDISNPKLCQLYEKYESSTPFLSITSPYWHDMPRHVALRNFRSHGGYLWTKESHFRYRMTVRYIAKSDSLGLLRLFGEDGAFGCETFSFDGVTVSRDKLDSILEIYYLRKVLGIGIFDRLNVLDIGAGYGRLAHRFASLFRNCRFYCTDAVPISTFLCDFYLRFRGVDNAYVVPLHELDSLRGYGFDVALSVHSFPEQTRASVEFWLTALDHLDVKRLVIVDHDGRWLSLEPPDNRKSSYFEILHAHGWSLLDARPKYETFVGNLFCIFPEAVYSLFVRN